jgi:pyroglutamyl-peptidase
MAIYNDRMNDRDDKRSTVLLTGFGPFPGIPVNASAGVVRKLVRLARRAFPQFRFASAVLPTEWRQAPRRVAALHRRYRPALAMHFGVASGTNTIRLETRAANVCRASPDAAGLLPLTPTLSTDGPAERRVTIDLSEISNTLEARGFPISISDDAGGYLCNAVLYQSLASAERAHAAVGFVHIPADVLGSHVAIDEIAAAALEIVALALHGIRKPAHAGAKKF